jgi:hypothetical protein
MRNGSLGFNYKPLESHITYYQQFFTDYNLNGKAIKLFFLFSRLRNRITCIFLGMDFIDVTAVRFRAPLPENMRDLDRTLDEFFGRHRTGEIRYEVDNPTSPTPPTLTASVATATLSSHLAAHSKVWTASSTSVGHLRSRSIAKLTPCELEADVLVEHILNRSNNFTTPLSQVSETPVTGITLTLFVAFNLS